MRATLQPLRTRDLDAALRAAEDDAGALAFALHPDVDLERLYLLASWAPVAALTGTPTACSNSAWLQGLTRTPFETPGRALQSARNGVQARRWLGLGIAQSWTVGGPVLDSDIVTELHLLAHAGLIPQEALGKVWAVSPALRGWLVALGIQPATADALEAELQVWLDRVYEGQRAGVHPVLMAARAQLGLMRMRPFPIGNAKVSHLVAEGLLAEAGYPPLPLEALCVANRDVLQRHLHSAVTTGDEVPWATWFARCVSRAAGIAREEAPTLAAIRTRLLDVLDALRDRDDVPDDRLDPLVEALCRFPVTYVRALSRDAGDLRPLTVRQLTAKARRAGDILPVPLGGKPPMTYLAAPDVLDFSRHLVSLGRRLDWR